MKNRVMAAIGHSKQALLFVELFVNSNGVPSVMVSEDKPLPSEKLCENLLLELNAWLRENKCSDVYLIQTFEYSDGSYDFRYFPLESVTINEDIILRAKNTESIELREHFDAFDDNMFE